MSRFLLDTGPLVAYINRRDRHHSWARKQLSRIEPPVLSCEAVLAEACFLLQSQQGGPEAVLGLVQRGLILLPLHFQNEAEAIAKLVARYSNVPMDLADACLVRLAELHSDSLVLTLDSDFRIYRKHGRIEIPVRMPA